MNGTVVYVHGDGEQPKEEDLKQAWDEALFGTDVGEHSRMAYWASLLHPPRRPTDREAADDVLLLLREPGSGPPMEARSTEEFVADTIVEVTGGDAPPNMRQYLERLARRADALAVEETDRGDVLMVMPGGRKVRLKAFRWFVRQHFEDVYKYAFGGWKERMQHVLHEALAGATAPLVVVGHSLGSVIAYDVLHDARYRRLEVALFASVGSPLAVREVQDVIRQPLEVPPPVRFWRNAADRLDLIAFDKTIVPEFDPVDRCEDHRVRNDGDNHHEIGPYLGAHPIQAPIHELLGVPRRP